MQMTLVDREEQRRSRLSLLGLVGVLVGTGTFLYQVPGPPHLPATWPTWARIVATLQGSDLPLDGVVYVLTLLAWVLWVWLAFSLVLELLVVTAEAVSHGASWAQSMRAAADHLTAPFVRRVVQGAVVTAVVVNLVGRSAMPAFAAPLSETRVVLYQDAPSHPAVPIATEEAEDTSRVVEYTVQPGDSLWVIAERFYGDGDAFPRIVSANVGRPMLGNQRFTPAGVIHPGWVLVIPLPDEAPQQPQKQTTYVVAAGDSLWSIADRLLGDPLRWPEIFELNRGVAHHPQYGWTLTNPNLIWPGLQLTLPVEASPEPAPPTTSTSVAPAPVAPAPIVPQPPEPPPLPSPLPETSIAPAPQLPTLPPVQAETPVATPVAVATPAPVPQSEGLPAVVWGAVGLMVVAAGVAGVAMRRRVRRSLAEPPVVNPDEVMPPRGDFIDAEFARLLRHRLHSGEVEAAVLVTEQTLRFLDEQGITEVSPVCAYQARQAVDLTLMASLHDQARIAEVAPKLAERLGGTVETGNSYDGDITLQISEPKLASLLAPSARSRELSRLIAVGLAPRQTAVYANWPTMGHVLVPGLQGAGVDTTLVSLVCALTTRHRPDALHLYTIASRRALPPQLFQLPHQVEVVEPSDAAGVEALLERVQAELVRRMSAEAADVEMARPPNLVVVLGELADIQETSALEMIGAHGPSYGIQLLVATSQLEAIPDGTLKLFPTRVMLQMLDDEASIRVLGEPDAADLGRGDLILTIDGRWPIRLRGFRVSPEHLDQLVQVMREGYPTSAPVEPESPDVDDEPGMAEASEDDSVPENNNGAIHSADLAVAEPIVVVSPNGAEEHHDEAAPTGELEPSDGPAAPLPANGKAAAREPRSVAKLQDTSERLIQVQCFGEFAVRYGGKTLEAYHEGRALYKSWELLAYLASHPQQGVSIDKLMADMWPDADVSNGRNPLHMATHKLRKLLMAEAKGLSADAIRVDREGVCVLDSVFIRSDAHQFLALIRAAEKAPFAEAQPALEQALTLYQGDLLPANRTPSYPWVDDRGETGLTLRETYRLEYQEATHRLARLYLQAGEAQRAVPLLKGILQQEPLLEDVVCDLYRCYQQLGDLGALRREDRRLRHALYTAYYDPHNPDDDPGLYPPEAETIAVFNDARKALEDKEHSAINGG